MLEGIRVIELTTEVGGALTGRLLAAYGADVVVVEPPAGHPIRSLAPRAGDSPDESILFAYLGAGKRSMVADLATGADRELVRNLIAGADIVLDSHAPGELAAAGLDPARLIAEQPSLVVTSITPYGQTGPRANWRSTAITAAAAGGQMSICGDPDKPPLKTAGNQGHYQAGLHAFSATLTALFAARRTGIGDWLDISVQEVQVCTLELSIATALMAGTDGGRLTGNRTFAQWGIHECKDGYIGLAAMPRQTFNVMDCIGHPELKEQPGFASGWQPEPNEVLSILVPEWTAQYTDDEIFEIAAKYRAPFSVIPGPRRLLEWPGLADIDFWKWVEHPVLGKHPLPSPPIELNHGDRGKAIRAPLLGEHSEELRTEAAAATPPANANEAPASADLPFDGIRVVDMTAVWAGPYGTRFLADLGADVIKVEGPSTPDPIRTMAGARTVPEINQSSYFNEYNRNKNGISLDIKTREGMETLRALIANADVFIENWSSGVADRIGLGYEEVKAIKPDIVYVSMPGFGHRGRDHDRIGFGPTIEQMGGLVALQGYEGGEPHRSGISYGDPVAGTLAAGATAMGLYHREVTGESTYAVVAQRDAICNLVGEYVVAEALGHPLPTRIGSKDAEWAPHNVYPGAPTEPRPVGLVGLELNDSWLVIAIDSDEAWRSLKGIIGDPRLDKSHYDTQAGRYAAQDDIDAVISEWSSRQEVNAAAAELQAAGIAAAPVLTPLALTVDEHLLAREAFLEYSHPDMGDGRTTRPAWRMARRPATSARSAPRFGEHTAEVLGRVLGYTDAQVEDLRAKSVVTEELILGAAG